MASPYDPTHWYWVVAGSLTEVFSTADAAYVVVTDTNYLAWVAQGNQARAINTDGELSWVLVEAGLPWSVVMEVGQTDMGILDAQQIQMVRMVTGVVLTSTGTPAVNGRYAIDSVSVGYLNGLYVGVKVGDHFPGGTTTFNYPDMSGATHSFTETTFVALALGVRDYLYGLSQAAKNNTAPPSNAINIA